MICSVHFCGRTNYSRVLYGWCTRCIRIRNRFLYKQDHQVTATLIATPCIGLYSAMCIAHNCTSGGRANMSFKCSICMAMRCYDRLKDICSIRSAFCSSSYCRPVELPCDSALQTCMIYIHSLLYNNTHPSKYRPRAILSSTGYARSLNNSGVCTPQWNITGHTGSALLSSHRTYLDAALSNSSSVDAVAA